MRPRASLLTKPLFLAIAASAVLSSGCASLNLSSLSLSGSAQPNQTLAPNTPTFTVELHPAGRPPQRAALPLTQSMLASQALAMAKARDHFTRFDAHIVRATPQGELKLPLLWEGGSGVLSPSSDYSVHPNDRLVIAENTNTVIGDMTEKALRPLAFLRK